MPRLILRRAMPSAPQRPHTIRQRVRRATVRVALLSLILWAGAASLQFSASATAYAAPLATADDWPMFLHDPARSAASGDTTLSASNAAQLAKLWSYKTGGVVAASPTIVGGTVYVGSWDGYEYALDATTGALKWKTYLGVTNAPACNPPAAGISSAATVQGGVVYVGGGDSNWYALNAT
ncbi:MAG: outer membrane protein assembly factor BamB family protein, partial [Ktedonobacterales bacterium]